MVGAFKRIRVGLAMPALGLALATVGPHPATARPKLAPKVWILGPDTKGPYVRPPNATTRAQRALVQGKPCITCGTTAPRMNADHTKPLSHQYYLGALDKTQYRSPEAVQPQCPTCSARQGGVIAGATRKLREFLKKPPGSS